MMAVSTLAPRIRKAARVIGKTLTLRNAGADDAEFILALRCDAHKAAHLSPTSPSLSDQRAWLERYGSSHDQAYFIIDGPNHEPLGTVRLYDARGDSFCWGSWILRDAAPASAAIESALIVYAYAVGTLGFGAAHFQVQRGNVRVRAFHERFGAVVTASTDDEFEYALNGDAIRASMQRYSRYLPAGATTEGLL